MSDDLTDAEYREIPALSYSLGKEYLRSPAHYKRATEHRTTKRAFDFGHVVHTLVLGEGPSVVEIPEDVLSASGSIGTKAAREFIATARAEGKVPMKAAEIEPAKGAAESVLAHPDARKLLEMAGQREVALLATDPETGVPIKGKLDHLADPVHGGRPIPVDLKTTGNASPRSVVKAIEDLHYDLQGDFYRHLVHLQRGEKPAPFVLIFVEQEPPHGVTVVQLAHEDWIKGGQKKRERILGLHAECTRKDDWPAYPPGIHALPPNGWYMTRLEESEGDL